MTSVNDSYKDHHRADYVECKQRCILCNLLKRKGSKIYKSSYAIKYHLTTEHSREDEIACGITRETILQTTRAIETAIQWNMLYDLSQRRSIS
ncbi:hypothetical protein NsoK4_08210 [Nitrosopumilus sp. K4]|uniref:hypothetical protein n=1 Tax=Nitrosopumilus sp. K4 TaxID=2795383 RepID=UPI001BADDABC|nr:hypothetical protein [Nitrosopumilus sp. K4]QUC64398.1 hypothetical protein NsoK4_08210 [Nitrosopumilus sp. K4]